jgi:hypothetical protein
MEGELSICLCLITFDAVDDDDDDDDDDDASSTVE